MSSPFLYLERIENTAYSIPAGHPRPPIPEPLTGLFLGCYSSVKEWARSSSWPAGVQAHCAVRAVGEGAGEFRASNRRERCGVWGPASERTGASMYTGKEALPTWRVPGPWQQIEGELALPGTGLAEASLGLERRKWVGAGAGGWGQRSHPQVSLGRCTGPCLKAGEPVAPSPSVSLV